MISTIEIENLAIRKRKKERTSAIWFIYNKIINLLFEKKKIKQLKAMAEIALENQNITQTNTPTFIFESKWYTYPYNASIPKDTKGLNRYLCKECLNKVYDIMKKDSFEEGVLLAKITTYISKIVCHCKTIESVQTLLPPDIALNVPHEMKEAYNIGDSLTEEEVINFKSKNKKNMQALSQFYMVELLMAKVK